MGESGTPNSRGTPSKTALTAIAGGGLILLVLCTQGGRLLWQFALQRLWPQAVLDAGGGPAPWLAGLASLLLTLLSLGGPILYLRRASRSRGFQLPLWAGRIPIWVLLPLFLGAMVTVNSVTNLLQALAASLAGVPTAETAALPEGFLARLLYFLTTCVAAALLEEILFRGYIQGLLRPTGRIAAMLLTTAAFTLMHTGLWELPTVFILGLLLSYVAEVSRSVRPCIALHLANNTFVFLTMWVREDMDGITALATIAWLMVVFIGLFAGAVWAVRKLRLGRGFRLKRDSGASTGRRAARMLKVPAFAAGMLVVAAQFIWQAFFT